MTGLDLGLGAVHQWHIDALARRAALHHGAVRRVLEDKLLRLRAECSAAQVLTVLAPQQPRQMQPLADLLAHIARQTGATPAPSAATPVPGGVRVAVPMELKAIRDYRGTWSRLSAERRLHQALAKVPHNAGPLNTQRLLHQALRLMHNASPGYLLHFMAHIESLLALDQINLPMPTLPTAKGVAPRPQRSG